MRKIILPTQSELRKLLSYDAETGVLTWKSRPPSLFVKGGVNSQERSAATWNKRYSGKPAIACLDTNGYFHGHIFNRKVKAHRVVWKIFYGQDADIIDHVNGVKTDNRICNLRSCTSSENQKNTKIRSDNTSGKHGVSYYKPYGKWRARIGINGRSKTIGYYETKEEAVVARSASEVENGFHKNHGRSI